MSDILAEPSKVIVAYPILKTSGIITSMLNMESFAGRVFTCLVGNIFMI
jgi:hypothetical protein